ncbi:Vacuolar protein sorting-associated protein 55 like [Apostasia shenzhenica]|uniref:Vacuolar protein sorting-associated protein 55 like n=1 Tax=Apostasia shenzhenica TaxID=1088818 RepID=A0A2I0ACM3_9ASPA|nr:Vacuolar protein sorting-associated protein 55 like [Apostasia shenzhenica]
MPHHLIACLHTGKLALLAVMVAGGIVLQVLACSLYNNWWPMLTVVMYVILPMPLLFFAGSDSSSLMSSDADSWVDVTKFLTGASMVGSIAIPSILKHAGIICWGALAMELSSFFIFGVAIVFFQQMNNETEYNLF